MKNKMSVLCAMMLIMTGGVFSVASAEDNAPSAMIVYPAGSQQSFKGADDYFTGDVQVDLLFPKTDHTHFSGAYVTFQPGARTAWHDHPAGQHMIVTSGVGLTQEWGGPIREIKKGDVVWCPPDIKHWHGASYNQPMTHMVITGSLDNKNVTWMEKVTDAQYYGNSNKKDKKMENVQALSRKQQAIVPIAAFAASGDLDRLKTALGQGLEAGLTVNEIKEILVHIYAYAGFPRSLNAIQAFMTVLDERKAKGITDPEGKDSSPLPADANMLALGEKVQTQIVGVPVSGPLYDFAPAIDQYLKSHLFGDIFARDVLDFEAREIATVSALSAMEGVEPQLAAHVGLAMNVGLTKEQMAALATVLENKVGNQEYLRCNEALQRILKK